MPVDSAALLKGLKPLLKALEKDLLARAQDTGVDVALKVAWKRERDASRTGDAFPVWRRRRVTQVAVAWILSCVFVRTLEDRGFLDRRRIAGPGADDGEALFGDLVPYLTARDYLLTVFRELSELPGAAAVFDPRHNPVWVLAPSADAARRLLDYFRKPTKIGRQTLEPPTFDGTDTRFLGDLYQKLSEDVRKRFALLQTPEFVEEFILEQTLDPAIAEFGLAEVTLIDPTCGSGHFLLGAFRRLLARWVDAEPGTPRIELARRALAQVYGADINPYAVAIARFRLTMEFLQAVGIDKLARAPELPLNLCVADSLLHGVTGSQGRLSSQLEGEARKQWGDQLFALEDEELALRILGGRYHAVVGNPPYIAEKDTAKRRHYLRLYESAVGKYTLSAPFTERFFQLAGPNGGFVGLINSNAFTKRDFGIVLVTSVLPRVGVTKLIDTSGAYLPGHGTPTLLIFGRNRRTASAGATAVLGKRGESKEPANPVSAPVWTELTTHHDEIGYDGRFVSVESIPARELAQHPWVLVGGGARRLKQALEGFASQSLGTLIVGDIGVSINVGHDEIYLRRQRELSSSMLPSVDIVVGEEIRDWSVSSITKLLRPFSWPLMNVEAPEALQRYFWRWKPLLRSRILSGTTQLQETSRQWFDVQRLARAKHETPLSLVFAAVATHNHFALDRGSRVFKRSAPLIKLDTSLDETAHQTLLAILASSTSAFWCRLVMFPKGGDQMGEGGRVSATPWQDRLDYAGNLLKKLPVPDLDAARPHLLPLVEKMESVVSDVEALAPAKALAACLAKGAPSARAIRTAQERATAELERLRGLMVSLQEEMDWRVYGLFDLPTLTAADDDVLSPARPEHRPFEVRLAREVDEDISASEWFRIHKREPPVDVGGPQAGLYQRRLRLIDQHKELQLLETPENKRRWSPRSYDKEFESAYRDYLLGRIEQVFSEADSPEAMSARELAQALHRDPAVLAVAEVYTGDAAPDLARLFSQLTKAEAVPYVAALRYTASGMEKRREWEKVWDLQRREDAGEKVKIDKPPEYKTADFQGGCWSHRGKLDVPKERFVSYPNAETENDETPLLGWAGWNHLQKAQALAAVYQKRKTEEGWDGQALTPLLAGLHELVPWLLQWHDVPDDAFGGRRLGSFFRDFLNAELRTWGLSETDLTAWRPGGA